MDIEGNVQTIALMEPRSLDHCTMESLGKAKSRHFFFIENLIEFYILKFIYKNVIQFLVQVIVISCEGHN